MARLAMQVTVENNTALLKKVKQERTGRLVG